MEKKYLTIILIIFAGLTSCKKDETQRSEPETKANISGSVNLYDDGIMQVDNSGMTVTVEGTTPLITTTTDSNGDFTLTDVPFGTYSLKYAKSGYGTFKRFDVVHQNGATIIPDHPSLGQLSNTRITKLTLGSSSNFPVILTATTSPAGNIGNTKYIRFFFSTSSKVSNENYENVLETFVVNINPYNLNLSTAALDALGFPTGTTVYARCYGESFWGNNYNDSNSGMDIFPNLNPNTVSSISFVIP